MSSWVAARGCCGPLTVAVQQGATEQQARGETKRRRRRRHQGGTPQHSGRRNPSPRWCPLGAGSGVTTTRQGNLPRLKLWLKRLSVSGIALVQLERIYLRLRHFFALNCWNFTFFFIYECVNYTLCFILTQSLWLLFISELKSSCEWLAHLVSLTIHLHWHCTWSVCHQTFWPVGHNEF